MLAEGTADVLLGLKPLAHGRPRDAAPVEGFASTGMRVEHLGAGLLGLRRQLQLQKTSRCIEKSPAHQICLRR